MEGKLIKSTVQYRLLNEDGIVIATSFYNGKLSLKNCETIECGYDLEELGYKYYTSNDHYTVEDSVHFINGMKKILEILGNKKFSEADIEKAFDQGYSYADEKLISRKHDEDCEYTYNALLQSLQQTEWDVEIVTEEILVDFNDEGQEQYVKQPKLDSDGCLILKRL